MSPQYEIPARVLANAEKRLAVRTRFTRRPCSTCRQPATHWPATGHPACETHRITQPPATPDPARTLTALRQAAGLPTDVRPAYRTVSDERAEAKGQRVSAARRAQARGDQP